MNKQVDFWEGNFGDEYTKRNSYDIDSLYKKRFGKTCVQIYKDFFSKIPKDARILEVGCNRGLQLDILNNMGFKNLWGIEINKKAVRLARKNRDWNILEGNALEIPFKDGYFDMVFTSGVLIHIAPKNLPKAMKEMARVSKKYVFGFEYFSDTCQEILYRGNKDRLWKNNFPELFLKYNPGLKSVKSEKLRYLDESGNVDIAYLFEKKKK